MSDKPRKIKPIFSCTQLNDDLWVVRHKRTGRSVGQIVKDSDGRWLFFFETLMNGGWHGHAMAELAGIVARFPSEA